MVSPPAAARYGSLSFIAVLTNTLAMDFAVWLFLPLLYGEIIVLPILLIDLIISVVVSRYPGNVGQFGRGLLIGCLSGPLSLIIFIPVLFLANVWRLI
jgi:hypothetical protein